MGSTTLTSTALLARRFSTVPGERMSTKTRCSSSQTAVVPLGDRLGVPSGQTVATNASRCSMTTRFISAVSFDTDGILLKAGVRSVVLADERLLATLWPRSCGGRCSPFVFLCLLGFPGPNHLRVARLVHRNLP